MIVLGLVLYAIGGLPFLLWGMFMRTVVGIALDLAGELGHA